MQGPAGYFDWLPTEIKTVDLGPYVDSLSKIVMRMVFYREAPEELTAELQVEAHRYSFQYFELFFNLSLIDPLKVPSRAASCGNIPLLKWAHQRGCRRDTSVPHMAVRHGHLETVIWLVENRWPNGKFLLETAAEHGHLNILEWLLKRGERCNAETLRQAIKGGHLEVSQRVYESLSAIELRQIQPTVCAVACDRLEILKWFRNKGLSDIKEEFLTAVQLGRLEILESMYSWHVEEHFNTIVSQANLTVIEWLYQQFPHRKEEMIAMVELNKRQRMVEWLRKQS